MRQIQSHTRRFGKPDLHTTAVRQTQFCVAANVFDTEMGEAYTSFDIQAKGSVLLRLPSRPLLVIDYPDREPDGLPYFAVEGKLSEQAKPVRKILGDIETTPRQLCLGNCEPGSEVVAEVSVLLVETGDLGVGLVLGQTESC